MADSDTAATGVKARRSGEASKSAKSTKAGKAEKTLVTLLLDRSGSMQAVKDDTIGAINAYIDTLRESGEDIRFSLVQFDSLGEGVRLEKIHVATRIEDVAKLTGADFQPGGTTPLIDASCTVIRSVADSLTPKKAKNTKVVFAIQTDGNENASVENNWTGLKSLIAEKEAAGWEFAFMGCGIDAYDQGARMGIDRAKTVSYGTDAKETRAAFAASAHNTALYAGGAMADIGYTDRQKLDAGDHVRQGRR